MLLVHELAHREGCSAELDTVVPLNLSQSHDCEVGISAPDGEPEIDHPPSCLRDIERSDLPRSWTTSTAPPPGDRVSVTSVHFAELSRWF